MDDVTARGVSLQVVTAKNARHIVRGIARFSNVDNVKAMVLSVVGVVNEDQYEWTEHVYHIPFYIAYGHLDGSRFEVDNGVYVHNFVSGNTYGEGRLVATKAANLLQVLQASVES